MPLIRASFVMTDGMIDLLICIGAIIVAILIMAIFIPWLRDFRRELRYINMEIQRNTGREREHWIKRKKRLKRSILPFFHY